MAFRKTGAFHPPQEIVVLTCDVCERDIGYEDGGRARGHLRLTRHPNASGLNDQAPEIIVCSRECLGAYATTITGLDREPGVPKGGAPGGAPRKKGRA